MTATITATPNAPAEVAAADQLAAARAALAKAKTAAKAEREAKKAERDAAKKDGKKSAAEKRALATKLVNAAAAIATTDAERATIAAWLHHLPADRDEFLKVLPRPDRSDWRDKK